MFSSSLAAVPQTMFSQSLAQSVPQTMFSPWLSASVPQTMFDAHALAAGLITPPLMRWLPQMI